MNKARFFLYTILLPAGLFAAQVHAQYEAYSPDRLLEELDASLQQAREVETALKENRRIKQDYDKEKQALDQERNSYDRDVSDYNRELAAFNDEVKKYDTDCGKKLEKAAFDACEVRADRLEPSKAALDRRLAQLNERKTALNRKMQAWNKKESERAAIGEQLLSQYDGYDATAKALVQVLNSRDAFRNSGCNSSPSLEAIRECMVKVLRNSQR